MKTLDGMTLLADIYDSFGEQCLRCDEFRTVGLFLPTENDPEALIGMALPFCEEHFAEAVGKLFFDRAFVKYTELDDAPVEE